VIEHFLTWVKLAFMTLSFTGHRRRAKEYQKKAENRYRQGFETFESHTVPQICRKDKQGVPKMSVR
jgi:hypothetical protein